MKKIILLFIFSLSLFPFLSQHRLVFLGIETATAQELSFEYSNGEGGYATMTAAVTPNKPSFCDNNDGSVTVNSDCDNCEISAFDQTNRDLFESEYCSNCSDITLGQFYGNDIIKVCVTLWTDGSQGCENVTIPTACPVYNINLNTLIRENQVFVSNGGDFTIYLSSENGDNNADHYTWSCLGLDNISINGGSVDGNYVFQGLKVGTYNITATAKDGTGSSGNLQVIIDCDNSNVTPFFIGDANITADHGDGGVINAGSDLNTSSTVTWSIASTNSINGINNEGNGTFDKVPAGSYTITATDAYGCTVSSNTVTVPNGLYIACEAAPLAYVNGETINICYNSNKPTSIFTLYDQDGNIIQNTNLSWVLPDGTIVANNTTGSQIIPISNSCTVCLKLNGITVSTITINVSTTCDCAGVPDGGSIVDKCEQCIPSGGTGCTKTACQELYGDGSYLDNCGVCFGGTSTNQPCVQDCNGIWSDNLHNGPVILGGCVNSCPPESYIQLVTTPILIAQNSNNPDKSASTPGMIYFDKPYNMLAKEGITRNQAYNDPNNLLVIQMQTLIQSLSSLPLPFQSGQTTISLSYDAMAMLNRFKNPISTDVNLNKYSSSSLTNAVKYAPQFTSWAGTIKTGFQNWLNQTTLNGLQVFYPMDRIAPVFNSSSDKVDGLTILIDNVTYAKAELTYFSYSSCNNQYSATITFTLHDDFGLDDGDIPNINEKYAFSKPFFRPWYILQHFRKGYQPFMTEIKIPITFTGIVSK